MIFSFPKNGTGKPVLAATDQLDDGSTIALKITIDEENVGLLCFLAQKYISVCFQGSAVFDFAGTGPQVPHNLNAPRQITFSAVLYCLRCMVGHDVPLNQVIINVCMACVFVDVKCDFTGLFKAY